MKTNIALIGMAGCGKSIVGRKLAGRLNLIFFDLDGILEVHSGKKIERLLKELGEESFLQFESDNLVAFLKTDPREFVISGGGSIILVEKAMRQLQELAATVFLDTPFKLIEERVRDGRVREGAIIGLRQKSLREVYDERLPLYAKYADWRLPTGNLAEEEVVERIVQWWRYANRGVCADA